MKASVGTCTVPRLRIFFCPPHKSLAFAGSPHLTQTAGNEFRPFQGFACGKTLDAADRSGEGKNYSLSSLRTAMKASVGTCTVPRLRIFFLPSFCFSSSFFLRVISPP